MTLLGAGLAAAQAPSGPSGSSSSARKARGVTIRAIVVEGNSKTQDETVILVSGVQVGDKFTPDMVDQIKRDLVDSGLFKDVQVAYQTVPEGVKLLIEARDKHSWVIAPTYYNQPTNQGGGIGFGENNLFGTNKKLLVYGQLATGDSFLVAGLIDPALLGSRFHWQGDLYFLRARSIEYRPPACWFDCESVQEVQELRQTKLNYLNLGLRLGVNLSRGVSFSARLRGAKVFFSQTKLGPDAALADIDPDLSPDASVPDPGTEGYDVSGEVRIDYDKRANWYGISHGDRYRMDFIYSLPSLGSDYDYWLASLQFTRARKYFEQHNVILNAMAGYGHSLPYQQEFTSGGTGLRGFKNNQFRGNVKLAANLEYSVQLLEIKGVATRLLVFGDTSYTAFVNTDEMASGRDYLPGHDAKGRAPFKNTIGLGTRLYVRQIVLPLLGLDVGYGLERGDYEIYLAIGLTDV